MYKFIVLFLLGFFIYKTIRNFLAGPAVKAKMKKNDKSTDDNFQKKYSDKIEDADFEELE